MHVVVKYSKYRDEYYVASEWYGRDKLLRVPGIDAISRDAIAAKHAEHKKRSSPEAAGFEW